MKIDRLIGILSILLQQEKVTAPYLADKFEVSRRTINRDIEDICKAGIPVVTSQGQNGGISIMDGYRMDKTLLTSSDMQAILAGLKSLDSVSGTKRYQQLMEKLASGNNSVLASNNHIMIDLASWYKFKRRLRTGGRWRSPTMLRAVRADELSNRIFLYLNGHPGICGVIAVRNRITGCLS